MNSLIEHLRKKTVENVFSTKTMQDVWPVWQTEIQKILGKPPYKATSLIGLGDHLSDIFKSTGKAGRGQDSLSGGGTAWEGLVCWYLNLCLVGSRAVIFKPAKTLVPDPVFHAISVKYHNFKSNTESDLIGMVFPNKTEYTASLDNLTNFEVEGKSIFKKGNLDYKSFINFLVDRDFELTEASIIQCKTNWNDNAQIPMLWDMIYRTKEFIDTGIVVGDKSYSIRNLSKFSYSFVTVPSTKMDKIKSTSVSVKRVMGLTGGNYWGYPSKPSVAQSIAEIFSRNYDSASSVRGQRIDLAEADFEKQYSYFNLIS